MKFKRVEEKRYRLIESSDYSFEKYRAKADRMMERNYSEDFEMLKYHKWYLDFEPEYIFLYATDYDTYVVVITGYDKTEEFDTQEEAEKYYDDFFRDDEEDELEEDIDSGYILTHCPECSSKNRVFVKFPAFNKPFEDTQYTCDKCGCKALVKDSHKYAEDGTIIEGVEDDYQKKIEEYKDKLIEVNSAIEKLLDRKRKYEESTPEVRKAMDSMADGDYLGNLKSDMADLETKQKSLMHNIEVTSEIMKNGGQLKMQDLQLTTEKLTEATSTKTISYKDTTYTVTSVPVSSLQVGDKVIVKNGRFTEGVGILDKKYYSSDVQAFILSYKMVASCWDRHIKKSTSGYEEQISDDEYRTGEIYKVISEVKNSDELENRQAKVLVPVKPSETEIQQYNLSVEPVNKYSFTITGKYKDIRDYMTGDYGLYDQIDSIEIVERVKESLTEKWETFDTDWGPEKLWHSSSASEFRAFLQNAPSAGIKGLRLVIGDGIYLAARASDLNHDTIVDIATLNYLINGTEESEWSTCGFPKVADFEIDNFEGKDYDEIERALAAEWAEQDKAEYAALAGKEYKVINRETGEAHTFVRDGKQHILVADCGTFEVALYNFYSREHIAYQNGDGGIKTNFQLFETSSTYYALKPLIKKLYMTNTENLTEGFWKDFIGIFKELGRNETKRFKTEQEAKTWIEKTISPKKIDKWYKPFYSKSTFGIGDWCVNYNTKDFRIYDKDYKEEETKKPVNNKTSNQNNSDESGTPPKAGNMAREDDTIMPRKRERVLAAYQPDNNANLSLKEAQAKEYEYSTETMDGVKFSIYEYTSGPKAGKVQISSLHPYDDADYHWATSKDSGKTFRIYIESPGKYVETFTNDSPTYDKVMARLNELDRAKKIKPRMIHN